jgi:hypothetical protein
MLRYLAMLGIILSATAIAPNLNVTVCGAGTESANGVYTRHGLYEGVSEYRNAAGAALYRTSGVWALSLDSATLYRTADGELSSSVPIGSRWLALTGIAPLPWLQNGLCPVSPKAILDPMYPYAHWYLKVFDSAGISQHTLVLA